MLGWPRPRTFIAGLVIGALTLGAIAQFAVGPFDPWYKKATKPFGPDQHGRWPTHDIWQHKYPPICIGDLSWVPVHVERRDFTSTYLNGDRLLGYWNKEPRPYGTIYISSEIDDVTASHVFHHEACHAVTAQYGKANWHK